jgi:FtsZ-interacting cell division protein YlmF
VEERRQRQAPVFVKHTENDGATFGQRLVCSLCIFHQLPACSDGDLGEEEEQEQEQEQEEEEEEQEEEEEEESLFRRRRKRKKRRKTRKRRRGTKVGGESEGSMRSVRIRSAPGFETHRDTERHRERHTRRCALSC